MAHAYRVAERFGALEEPRIGIVLDTLCVQAHVAMTRHILHPAPIARVGDYYAVARSTPTFHLRNHMPHIHAPGLVLRFDPKTLAAQGATYTGKDDVELSAQQYFVCIEANAKDALWVPLFPGPGPGRKGIPTTAKSGHTRWTKSSSFYDSAQVCRIAHKAAQRAAEVAYDESTPKLPSRMLPAYLPLRAEFPDDAAFRPMAGNVAIR